MRREIDYKRYRFTVKEWLMYAGGGFLALLLLARLFYGTGYAVIVLLPVLAVFLFRKKKELKKKRQQKLQVQFKDMLIALSTSLITGYSVENALRRAETEMEKLYGKDGYITSELARMNREIHLNISPEESFRRCAARTGVEEIRLFSEVFSVAQQSGGDMVSIVKNTAGRISEKIEVKREIATVISGKRMEQRVLCAVPVGIILYLEMSSPGYFSGMYGNLSGIAVMTTCLIVYFLSWILGERMVAIEI